MFVSLTPALGPRTKVPQLVPVMMTMAGDGGMMTMFQCLKYRDIGNKSDLGYKITMMELELWWDVSSHWELDKNNF